MAAKKRQIDAEGFILSSSVDLIYSDNVKKTLTRNNLHEYDYDFTWKEVYIDVIKDLYPEYCPRKSDVVSISVSNKLNGTLQFSPDLSEEIRIVRKFDSSLKYVSFTVKRDGQSTDTETGSQTPSKSAFEVLMQASTSKKPASLRDETGERFTAKDRLYNSLVTILNESADHFPGSWSGDTMTSQIMVLVNAIWYLSGNMMTINERAQHIADIEPIPQRFLQFDPVNDYKKKRKKRPQLSSQEMKLQGQCLLTLSNKPFCLNWSIKKDIERLAKSCDSYAIFLEKKNEQQATRQQKSHPARQVDDDTIIQSFIKVDCVNKKYSVLDNALSELNVFQPLYFDEAVHLAHEYKFEKPDQKYKFFSGLGLSSDVHVLRYDPGAGLGSTHYVWKVPPDATQEEIFQKDTRILQDVKHNLLEFHTRAMRRQFINMYENIAGSKIPSYILRSIYAVLTNDATSDQNPDLDQRVRLAVLANEPELVVDLRHLNKGRPSDTYDIFFEELEKDIQDQIAADERRHNIEHISTYLSVRDLIEQVKKKLPENTPVPSESTVLLAFVPTNSHSKVAKLYKGRIPLRLKVQTRQLRASHEDEHYCAALYKYARHYAVKHKDDVTFVCMDDKAKVDFGEPGMLTSSGVRGKKSIIPMTSNLSCLDHDTHSKGSLTPSVVLDVDLPEDENDSFYRGQVSLTIKDSVFQASTPFRHAAELQTILEKKQSKRPVLIMFTDGGPDHRLTYNSVKLSLIVLLKRLGLEFLVALRTAPGHSWVNPAERIMSLLYVYKFIITYYNCHCSKNTLSREALLLSNTEVR